MRLDLFLYTTYNLKSRTYAQELVKKGKVKVNGDVVSKVSLEVSDKDNIEVNLDESFASQGAFKLKKAIEEFNISVDGKICADFGCSNGGFTDILLRNNAKLIYAYDVGECALEKSLLESGKVIFIKQNLRELPDDVKKVDFVCCDVSFISIKLIIPSIYKVLNDGGEGVILIKPQFEAGKQYLNKSVIVKDKKIHEKIKEDVCACLEATNLKVKGITTSPIFYENKNIEYLVYFKKGN